MWKPVVVVVGGYLLLIATVCVHAPDLHQPCPHRIEVDELAIGRIIGTVVQTNRGCQLRLFAAVSRDGVDVIFTKVRLQMS